MKIYFKIIFLFILITLFFNYVPQLISSQHDELFVNGIISIIISPVGLYYFYRKLF